MTEKTLIAHWPLQSDASDNVGHHDGAAQGVTYVQGARGSVARFDGAASQIVVPASEALRLGNADFTIAVWVRCDKPMRGAFGDILSKFDAANRCGINLTIAGSSPGYNGMSDTRHVHLGIDDGYISGWEDCGKPCPSNALIANLLAMDGELYAGIADAADPWDANRVFRWRGGQEWDDCGRLGSDLRHRSVQGMLVHQGVLYAAAGVWDWIKAAGRVPGFTPAPSRVYAYEGGQTWRDLGAPDGISPRAFSMVSFEGHLYVSLDRAGGGKCFRLEGDRWVDCGSIEPDNFECLMPMGGVLYGATHHTIARYEGGQRWTVIGHEPFGITQIHSMQVYEGQLHIGTWPQGYVLRYEGDGQWANTGRLGIPAGFQECNEVNDLTVHNGKLYAGVIPKAQVYRYESDGHWTLIGSLGSQPGWRDIKSDTWRRVPTITTFRGRLFAGTGSCVSRAEDVDPDGSLGRVYALQAGQMASYDRDLGDQWAHLAAVREGKRLSLYVNGRLVASSEAPARQVLDLANLEPLRIGGGPQGHFAGELSDLRLYEAALDGADVRALAG